MSDTNTYYNDSYCYPITQPKQEVCSTDTSYNKPGMPKPPAGWGRTIGFVDSVDGDDAGPESPDQN